MPGVDRNGRSLATIAVGEAVTLGDFAFPTLRSVCADLGLVRGTIVRCRVASPGVLLLERADGKQVRIDAAWARLIGVDSLSSEPA